MSNVFERFRDWDIQVLSKVLKVFVWSGYINIDHYHIWILNYDYFKFDIMNGYK